MGALPGSLISEVCFWNCFSKAMVTVKTGYQEKLNASH